MQIAQSICQCHICGNPQESNTNQDNKQNVIFYWHKLFFNWCLLLLAGVETHENAQFIYKVQHILRIRKNRTRTRTTKITLFLWVLLFFIGTSCSLLWPCWWEWTPMEIAQFINKCNIFANSQESNTN